MASIAHLPPQLREAISKLSLSQVLQAAQNVSPGVLEKLAAILPTARDSLNQETISNLFDMAKQHCSDNPIQAAGLVVAVLITAFPGAVVVPFLASLGFTSVGPAAGSIASIWMSKLGVSAVYSTLQSAAMAGYGAGIVAGITQVGAAVGAAANVAYTWFSRGQNGERQVSATV